MATLTSSETFTVGDAATEIESVDVLVVAAGGVATGKGRLVHPSLGTYDYEEAPDEWTNIDGDVIIPPIWQHSRALDGGPNTLWAGHIKDVVCRERWNASGIQMPIDMLRQLVSFWVNPPDPATGYVLWYPSYTNSLGYQVVMLAITVGGQEVTLDFISRQGWIRGAVEVQLQVVGYAP